jgi:hypothetical protein
MSKMDDDALAAHYTDPANRVISGRPRKQRRPRQQVLSSHVPIRFSPETMARVRTAAHDDGLTVSSWIRWIVEQEVARRLPKTPQTWLSTWTQTTITGLKSNEPPTRSALVEESRLAS